MTAIAGRESVRATMTMRSTPLLLPVVMLLGCPADDDGTAGETHADHGTGTADSGTAEHGSESASSSETGVDGAVAAYCACVLENCHEPYHAKWGEDEIMAQAACLAEAGALPQNGAPIEMGNFLECRQHFCDAAMADPSVCTNALGDAVCM